MKPAKKNTSFKKLGWVTLSVVAFLLLASSIGYYVVFRHNKQVVNALEWGQHITLAIATNDVVEGKFQTVKEAKLPENLPQEEKVPEAGIEENADAKEEKQDNQQTHESVKQEKVQQASQKTPAIKTESDKQKQPEIVPVAATQDSRPKIALLITGLGLSKSSTERALTLPPEVTLGFSPYSLDIKQWVGHALKDGHEVFINVPMEATDSPLDDPGSFALVTNLNAENNLKRLNWVLSRVEGYTGVYSDPDEKFTEFQSSIRPVLQDFKKRNLFFVYGAGYSNASLLKLAKDVSQPTVVSDLVIDTKISTASIKESLAALEKSALKNGYALGMGAPYPITIKILEQWIPTLKEKGIEVVPASVLLKKKESVVTQKQ